MPPLTLDGTNGVSAVQAGAVESGDLPAGSVIQVVDSQVTTEVTTTSFQVFVDSGLTASITPQSTSSKILVLAHQNFKIKRKNFFQFCAFRLLRDGTQIISYQGSSFQTFGLSTGNGLDSDLDAVMPIGYTDSPSTISQVSYKVQGASRESTDNAELRMQASGVPSTITLMEIAG